MLLALLVACSDYEFSDGKREPGDRPPRDEPGAETDTSAVEGDTGDTGAGTVDVPGEEGDPCAATHTVRIGLAADDVWTAWIAGQELGPYEQWWETVWSTVELECGTYTLAVYATDAHQAISGFIGRVEVDGAVVAQTGDGSWKVYDGRPPAGTDWHRTAYDDSAWGTGQGCEYGAATGWWGSSPADLTGAGAWWIWPRDCLALGDAAFRVTISVP